LFGTGKIIALSIIQNKGCSSALSLAQHLFCLALCVTNILFFTLNDTFSKCAASKVSENDNGYCLKFVFCIKYKITISNGNKNKMCIK
jgi:hypothetical protein